MPLKDDQADEPDEFTSITFHYPEGLRLISNGRLLSEFPGTDPGSLRTTIYAVRNPINSYDITFYLGDYVQFGELYKGENSNMMLNYFALRSNEKKARVQFAMTPDVLHCFEHWMGPYPFKEDMYKLIEAPYAGMEHQSAVAYGNKYKMGYLGRDRSKTGIGMQFDFILVHETGHEWFGNNITATDIACNWLHEGFTTYAECLYVECMFTKEKAFEYTRGEWKNILNDKPIIGPMGVNTEGSSDMYDKGSAIVHMIRMFINNDEAFRQLLRNMNRDFSRQTVTEEQVEAYIAQNAKFTFDSKPFFKQYLYTTQIPQLEYYLKDGFLFYRFTNCVAGFTMPLLLTISKVATTVTVNSNWNKIACATSKDFELPLNYLITFKAL